MTKPLSPGAQPGSPAVSQPADPLVSWVAPRVVRNTLLNLSGHLVPLAAGLFAIPVLVAELGTSRFGVLTLAWIAVGYFSLFDLGLGRALTKLVAERVGSAHENEVDGLARTALFFMLAFGAVGTGIGLIVAPWLTRDALRIPVELQAESEQAFRLLSLSLPIVITTAGLRGLLEGLHRFGVVNMIRIPSGVFSFVGPLLVLPFTTDLSAIVAVLVGGRILAWAAHLVCCAVARRNLFQSIAIDLGHLRLLLKFGGWMTVTNIVGPLMVYMDRLLIGALISAAAVAYYATPYEIITKLWLVPGALLGVLFPAFAAALRHDPKWVRDTFRRSVEVLLLLLLPATIGIVLFADEGLTLWLGADFAAQSSTVARWLAVGVFVNSLALVPFTLVQGAGRPDLTAKLHLLELPPYLAGLWWFTTRYGIEGAAVMWTLRIGMDSILLHALALRILPGGAPVLRRTAALVACAVAVVASASLPTTVPLKVSYAAAVLVALALLGWRLWACAPRPRASVTKGSPA
jgi:O-antigen/teichoic acid export membrane protein